LNASSPTIIKFLPIGPVPSSPSPYVYTIASAANIINGSSSNLTVSEDTRYNVTASVVGNTIQLNVSGSNATLYWNSANPADTWASGVWKNGANPTDTFMTADAVIFDDTATSTTVNISDGAAVMPMSVTVAGTKNYTFSGSTGKISGATGILMNGTGTLTINTPNDYLGQTGVNNGVLQFGNAAALNALTSSIVVNGGGSFNINGLTMTNNILGVIQGLEVQISGNGYNNQGAVFSSTGNQSALRRLVLNNDASIGAPGARWDMYNPVPGDTNVAYLHGNGHTLTKVGSGEIWLKEIGDTGLGNINIDVGVLGLQQHITAGLAGNTITVAGGAGMGLWDTGQYQTIQKKLVLQNNSRISSGGGALNSLEGNATLNGVVTFQTTVALNLTAPVGSKITGTGGVVKTNTGTLTLAGAKDFSGANDIQAGIMALADTGTLGNFQNAANTTLQLLAGSDHIVGDVSGTGSTVLEENALLTATSITQNTLTIRAGAKLTIAALPGGALAGMNSLSQVPEPSTWAMLMLAAAVLGIYWRRSR
jgi:autotransporter-associated beta strand protein